MIAMYQKEIGDGPHALMRKNNPNDHHVADHRHHHDTEISDSPQGDLPHRLDELVEAVAAVRGDICPVCAATVSAVVERVHFLGITPLQDLDV